jgi:hypothetical protein
MTDIQTDVKTLISEATTTAASAHDKLNSAAELLSDFMAAAENKLTAASRLAGQAEEKLIAAEEKFEKAKRLAKQVQFTADANKFRESVLLLIDNVPRQSETQIRHSLELLKESILEPAA